MSKHKRKFSNYLLGVFQYRLLTYQSMYLVAVVGVLYVAAVWPLLESVDDRATPLSERADSARVLLYLHGRVLPLLVPMALLILGHSIIQSHRVAGPIFRMRMVMKAIAQGDLSIRVRLRNRDYLREEEAQMNAMIEALSEHVGSLQKASSGLLATTEDLRLCVRRAELDGIHACAASLQEQVADLHLTTNAFHIDAPHSPSSPVAKAKAA